MPSSSSLPSCLSINGQSKHRGCDKQIECFGVALFWLTSASIDNAKTMHLVRRMWLSGTLQKALEIAFGSLLRLLVIME